MGPLNHILLVENDLAQRAVVRHALDSAGHRVTEATDGELAAKMLNDQGFQLVITDMLPPGQDGLGVVSYVKEHTPHTPVIVVGDAGAVNLAVEAMRRGAFDFQEKPLNLDRLLLAVQRALEKASLHRAFDYLRHEQPYIYRLENILARSQAMKLVLDQVTRVTSTDVTVLLTGETGTGKSLIAGAIHANSPRRDHTLVTVNCAALTETLLESELFGHEKGAFTGAHKYRTGRFEQAHGGTLFLDEIGDMSPATQAKVLRAIEDKVIQRVGGARSIQVDVRIIAATNVDLERAVREGRFRDDLFYRINVTPIRMPALRERPEDVRPLAELFLRRMSGEIKRPVKPLSQEALEALSAYQWPGNIRELRNLVERAILFANGPEITSNDLGLAQAVKSAPEAAKPVEMETLNLAQLEQWAIETALERSDWVQSHAAALLGISPRALSYKLDKLNLQNPGLLARRRPR